MATKGKKGQGGGINQSSRLTDAHNCIYNRWTGRTYNSKAYHRELSSISYISYNEKESEKE